MGRSRVVIGKREDLSEALKEMGGLESFVSAGSSVVIKPNVCIPGGCGEGKVTDPTLVGRIAELVRSITPNVVVGESPFSGFSGKATMQSTGIWDAAQRAGALPVDFTSAPVANLRVPSSLVFEELTVAKAAAQADVLISMPVMKTHLKTIVSLSLKNMMGVIPGSLKHQLHLRGLDEGIVDLNKALKTHLVILDAGVCQEGNGPINGTPRRMGLVVVGDNPVAVDIVCCHLMGIDPGEVGHLSLASREGIGPERMEEIDVLGFPAKMPEPFALPGTYRSRLFEIVCALETPATKFMVNLSRIRVDRHRCKLCGLCAAACPKNAISVGKKDLSIDHGSCIRCLCCVETCLNGALEIRGPLYSTMALGLAMALGGKEKRRK